MSQPPKPSEPTIGMPNPDPHRRIGAKNAVGGASPTQATAPPNLPIPKRNDTDQKDNLTPMGRFVPQHLHAKGGLGEVYLAIDQELQRPVALKRIAAAAQHSTQGVDRFLREAHLTARLEHPGIVPVYGCTQDNRGQPGYAMRFIEGETLGQAISRLHQHPVDYQALGFRQLLQKFIRVCDTIAYAHHKGIIHRDIKPENVLLGAFGETLVVDWGLAKVFSETDSRSEHEKNTSPWSCIQTESATSGATTMGTIVGTLAYMSPEQADGCVDKIGPATDIYSLGATLFVILTGRASVSGQKLEVARDRILAGDWPRPRELAERVPATLEKICLKAMALQPEDRYPAAAALASDVEKWLADEPVSVAAESWSERIARWMKRHRAWVGSALAATFACLVILAGAVAVIHKFWLNELAARQHAQKHADTESHWRRLTRQALDKMNGLVVEEWLLNQTTLTSQHREYLNESLQLYREFSNDARHEDEHQRDVAHALYNQGTILYALHLDAEADAALREAYARYHSLVEKMPDDVTLLLDCANVCHRLATIAERLERPKAEREFTSETDALARKAFVLAPSDPQVKHDLAKLFIKLGMSHRQRKQYQEALAAFEQAKTLFPNDKHTAGRAPQEIVQSADLNIQIAMVYVWLHRVPEALSTFRAAHLLLKRVIVDSPTNIAARQSLAQCLQEWSRWSDTASERANLARESIANFQVLLALQPANTNYRKDFGHAWESLAMAFVESASVKSAEEAFLVSFHALKQLAHDYPEDTQFREAAWRVAENCITFLIQHHLFAKAEELLPPLLREIEARRENDKINHNFRQHAAKAHFHLGQVYARTGRASLAEQELKIASSLRADLLREKSDALNYFAWYEVSIERVRIFIETRRHPEALPILHELESQFVALRSQCANDSGFRVTLCGLYCNYSNLLIALDSKSEKALHYYTLASDDLRELLTREPWNEPARSFFAKTNGNRGSLLCRLNRLEEGLKAFQDAEAAVGELRYTMLIADVNRLLGRVEQVSAAVQRLENDENLTPQLAVDSATILLRSTLKTPVAEQIHYRDRAVRLLRRALAARYFDQPAARTILQKKYFEFLRELPDFADLLPPKPTPMPNPKSMP